LQLSFLLCIGPLARLTPRFKPFLYNRRHLGVATFLVALVPGVPVTLWHHGFGELNPLLSLLISDPRYDSLVGFPFEALGLLALVMLFLLAATSHDFWNANLAQIGCAWAQRLTSPTTAPAW
jgi:methionine sulfoxide reductase heme-binding subunit